MDFYNVNCEFYFKYKFRDNYYHIRYVNSEILIKKIL